MRIIYILIGLAMMGTGVAMGLPGIRILKPWRDYYGKNKAIPAEALIVAMVPENEKPDSRVKLTIEYRGNGRLYSKEVMASSLYNTPEALNSYVDIYYSRIDPSHAFLKVDGDERPRGIALCLPGALLLTFGLFLMLIAIAMPTGLPFL